jgi:hypothetical protein
MAAAMSDDRESLAGVIEELVALQAEQQRMLGALAHVVTELVRHLDADLVEELED